VEGSGFVILFVVGQLAAYLLTPWQGSGRGIPRSCRLL
jgi:hypothetical protein